MLAGFIAYHYPRPHYRDEFFRRVEGVARVFRSAPGFLSADCWLTTDGETIVCVAKAESREALEAAMILRHSPQTRLALDAEFGEAPPGVVDGTNTELFARPHLVHQLVSR